MSVVTVRLDFENGWLRLVMGAIDGNLRLGSNLVEVFAVKDIPSHVVAFGSFGQGFLEGRGTLLAGSHRVSVVFDDVDNRKLKKCRQVERFVEGALIDGSVPKITKAAAAQTLVLEPESQSKTQGSLPAYYPVSTPVVL